MDDQKRDDTSRAADETDDISMDQAADDELSDDEMSNATAGILGFVFRKPTGSDEDAGPDGGSAGN